MKTENTNKNYYNQKQKRSWLGIKYTVIGCLIAISASFLFWTLIILYFK